MAHSAEELNYLKEEPLYHEDGQPYTLKELQERIRANKIDQGFNLDDPWEDFTYLIGEFGELAEAIRNPQREDVIEALVDIIIIGLGMFAMYKVNAYELVIKKILIVKQADYRQRGTNYNIRVSKKTKFDELEIPTEYQNISLPKIQELIMETKRSKGFNLDSDKLEIEYVCIGEEFSEMFMGLRKGRKYEFLDALTDTVIYSIGLVGILKVDAYDLVTKKMRCNEKRAYFRSDSGHLVREDQMK